MKQQDADLRHRLAVFAEDWDGVVTTGSYTDPTWLTTVYDHVPWRNDLAYPRADN